MEYLYEEEILNDPIILLGSTTIIPAFYFFLLICINQLFTLFKKTPAECDLDEINFSDDEKDIIRFIKGNKRTRFNLMEYLYEEEILNDPNDEDE